MHDWKIIGGTCFWKLVEIFDASGSKQFCVVWFQGTSIIDDIINETCAARFALKTNDKQEAIDYINKKTEEELDEQTWEYQTELKQQRVFKYYSNVPTEK